MSKIIIYDKYSLPNCIDEIEINSKVVCILDGGVRITGELTRNNFNSIYLYNDIDGKIWIKKLYIKELRVEVKESGIKMGKQEYINELEEIKNQQKALADKMELLQKKIEEEDTKKEWWKPSLGKEYWYININGIVKNSMCMNIKNNPIIDSLNCFKTKEEAERVAFEQLLHRKLQRFAKSNNEEEIDWKDERKSKYAIDYTNGELELDYTRHINYFGQIYFSSREIAEKAIEEFKDDLLRYFTSDR